MNRGLRGQRLVLASHNAGKLREMGTLLAPYGVDLVSAAAMGLGEPDETESTFEGNAILKARAAADASGLPALADDSGFCVAALGGLPGVWSADWAGHPRDFNAAMRKVQAAAAESQSGDRRAWFVCVLALAWPGSTAETFRGEIHGTWTWPPRGDKGFGYDPMFVPEGQAHTYGEIDAAEKHRDSHRTRAFLKLVDAHLL